jgi:hypothetical protein
MFLAFAAILVPRLDRDELAHPFEHPSTQEVDASDPPGRKRSRLASRHGRAILEIVLLRRVSEVADSIFDPNLDPNRPQQGPTQSDRFRRGPSGNPRTQGIFR